MNGDESFQSIAIAGTQSERSSPPKLTLKSFIQGLTNFLVNLFSNESSSEQESAMHESRLRQLQVKAATKAQESEPTDRHQSLASQLLQAEHAKEGVVRWCGNSDILVEQKFRTHDNLKGAAQCFEIDPMKADFTDEQRRRSVTKTVTKMHSLKEATKSLNENEVHPEYFPSKTAEHKTVEHALKEEEETCFADEWHAAPADLLSVSLTDYLQQNHRNPDCESECEIEIKLAEIIPAETPAPASKEISSNHPFINQESKPIEAASIKHDSPQRKSTIEAEIDLLMSKINASVPIIEVRHNDSGEWHSLPVHTPQATPKFTESDEICTRIEESARALDEALDEVRNQAGVDTGDSIPSIASHYAIDDLIASDRHNAIPQAPDKQTIQADVSGNQPTLQHHEDTVAPDNKQQSGGFSEECLLKLAGETSTPSKTLEYLSKHSNVEIRSAVARNMHAPQGVLSALSTDCDPLVAWQAQVTIKLVSEGCPPLCESGEAHSTLQ